MKPQWFDTAGDNLRMTHQHDFRENRNRNSNLIFYNNFEISDVTFWRSAQYQDFFAYIERAKGIYTGPSFSLPLLPPPHTPRVRARACAQPRACWREHKEHETHAVHPGLLRLGHAHAEASGQHRCFLSFFSFLTRSALCGGRSAPLAHRPMGRRAYQDAGATALRARVANTVLQRRHRVRAP